GGGIVEVAGESAFWRFELEHARAGVGKPAGAGRRCHRLFQRHDEKTRERESHAEPTAFDDSSCAGVTRASILKHRVISIRWIAGSSPAMTIRDCFIACAQYDLGRPSTCSARYDRMRLVEIGATW